MPQRTHTRVALLIAAMLGHALVSVAMLRGAQSERPAGFDAISIKTIDPVILVSRPPGTPPLAGMSEIMTFRAGTFRAPAVSARNLIAAAFGVKAWQVVSEADWIESARFEILAKTATEATRDTPIAETAQLLRGLLTDRFQLRAHMERRPFPVFALTVARQDQRLGPQLRRHDVDCDALRASAVRPAGIPPPPTRTDRPACGTNRWADGLIGGSVTMGELANTLTAAVRSQQIVVDRTNLPGRFDVDLSWSADPLRASGSAATPSPAPPDDGVMLSVALQEQLGLKLVLRPEPMDAVVVDHIERPSPN